MDVICRVPFIISVFTDFRGYACPKVKLWGRNVIIPTVLEVGILPIKPRPWGTWEKTDDWFGARW